MEGLGRADAGGSGQNDKDIATSSEAAKASAVSNEAPSIVTDETEKVVSVKNTPKIKDFIIRADLAVAIAEAYTTAAVTVAAGATIQAGGNVDIVATGTKNLSVSSATVSGWRR
jgi:hypothetical protein